MQQLTNVEQLITVSCMNVFNTVMCTALGTNPKFVTEVNRFLAMNRNVGYHELL